MPSIAKERWSALFGEEDDENVEDFKGFTKDEMYDTRVIKLPIFLMCVYVVY